jgi:predicted nuclease of restriction endonuclease-like RecB superfamily
MLRKTHVQPFLRVVSGDAKGGAEPRARLEIDFLPPGPEGGPLLPFLHRLCRITRRLEGAPRWAVAELLRRQERRVRDARRLAGITKALLDGCRFRREEGHEEAPELRKAVYQARGAAWPPVAGDEDRPWEEVARARGWTAEELRRRVLADRPDRAVLVRAVRWDGATLLARYNLGLVQAAVLDAESLVFRARGGWKGVFRAVRRVRLMAEITREGRRAYRLELTGPAAPFVARPQRYGIRMARILPELLRAPGARIEARVLHDGRPVTLTVEGGDPVFLPYLGTPRTGRPGGESRGRGTNRRGRRDSGHHDSRWEADLARALRERIQALRATAREGWTLVREDAPVLLPGGSVFLPDFTLRHRDGREAWVELVGFWTPEYLHAKLAKLQAAGVRNLVLAVPRSTGASHPEVARALEEEGHPVVWFTTSPRAGAVLEAAARVAVVP